MQKELSGKYMKIHRELAEKTTLHPITNVQDFYLRKSGVSFAIRDANAFSIAGTDMILVLGDFKPAIQTAKTAREAREQKPMPQIAASSRGAVVEEGGEPEEVRIEEEEEEEVRVEEADDGERQLDQDDIDLVMKHGQVSREEAIKVLRKNDCDPVNALIDLGK